MGHYTLSTDVCLYGVSLDLRQIDIVGVSFAGLVVWNNHGWWILGFLAVNTKCRAIIASWIRELKATNNCLIQMAMLWPLLLTLPLVCYLGTQRFWISQPLHSNTVRSFRTDTFDFIRAGGST